MRISLVLFLIIISSVVSGQEVLKQVIKKSKDKRIMESYYVTKKKKIKTGSYTKQLKDLVIEKGRYENKLKVGIWEYYNSHNMLELKYDFTNDSLIFLSENRQIELKYNLLYLGSTAEQRYVIASNVRYPIQAQLKRLSGKVIVLVDYDTESDMFQYQVVKSVDPILDSEAIRVSKVIPKVWKPVKYTTEFNKHQAYIPISFNMGY